MIKFVDPRQTELRADCEKCFGFCCVALYFSASEGFPIDKDASTPCINLKEDFTCKIHKDLIKKRLKGCTAYDCLGAGQKVAQHTFHGLDWQQVPKSAKKMFKSFLTMRQLHEILWYLAEAFALQDEPIIKEKIGLLLEKTENLTLLEVDALLTVDVDEHRNEVKRFLQNTSDRARKQARIGKHKYSKNIKSHQCDYFGFNLKDFDLIGADLKGACLIAANLKDQDLNGANLIGADLRDADISGANLKNSLFLTQGQINSAKGDSNTKLPQMLRTPDHWRK